MNARRPLFSMACVMAALSALPALADPPSAERIVREANQQWNQAFNAGDVDALTALYADTARLSPGNGQVLRGSEAIGELFQGFVDNGLHSHRIETVEVLESPEQITQLGYWRAIGGEADSPQEFGGVLVTVLEPDAEGDWKVKAHVWNTAP